MANTTAEGQYLPPQAELDDGLFDIAHVRHTSKANMFRLLPKYMKGIHGGIKQITGLKGKDILISCDNPFPLNLDGEISIVNRAHFKIIEKGIKIISRS